MKGGIDGVHHHAGRLDRPALVATNGMGDVIDQENGRVVAGVRTRTERALPTPARCSAAARSDSAWAKTRHSA
jgi:hypothetical protein